MPEIKDIIIHGEYKQMSIVLDEMPKFLYERRGNCLVASDDGFYGCYFYDRPSKNWEAFAGRKFDISMKGGTIEHAHGQWWDGKHQENAPEPIVNAGISTPDKLASCYVFMSSHISQKKVEAWLQQNKPASDYYKYKKRMGGEVPGEGG